MEGKAGYRDREKAAAQACPATQASCLVLQERCGARHPFHFTEEGMWQSEVTGPSSDSGRAGIQPLRLALVR